jgi:hypothetical protein
MVADGQPAQAPRIERKTTPFKPLPKGGGEDKFIGVDHLTYLGGDLVIIKDLLGTSLRGNDRRAGHKMIHDGAQNRWLRGGPFKFLRVGKEHKNHRPDQHLSHRKSPSPARPRGEGFHYGQRHNWGGGRAPPARAKKKFPRRWVWCVLGLDKHMGSLDLGLG